MKDFSQNGEQKIILDYFGYRIENGKAAVTPRVPPVVLDAGANDGLTFSNSRALIELGCSAVLVEPADIAFRKLLKNCDAELPENASCEYVHKMGGNYSELFLVNAAITPTDGPVDFYDSGTHLHKGDTGLLSTTRPEEIARWKKSGETFTKTTVRGITFETLMRETGVRHFDFISIDAEGADFDILKQIDLTQVGCRMLCVEVNARGDKEFTEYAKKHGLHLHWSCYENRIYAR